MTAFLYRLLDDDQGQDLIEYALLTTAIGLAAVAVFDLIRDNIQTTGASWDSQIDAIAEPNPPGSGS